MSNANLTNVNSGTKSLNAELKKKKKSTKTAVIVVAAVLVIMVSFCLSNHITGNKRLAEGNYAAAISAYGQDFLFSTPKRTEAILLAGEEAFSAQNYEEAMSYFASAGEAGKERWTDAVYEQGVVLLQNKDPDKALELLNKISDETRAQEQIGAAYLAIAQQQYADGDAETAIETAQRIQNTKYADVTAFFDMVYHDSGNELFDWLEYQDAKEAYEKCEKDPVAKVNAEILGELIAGNHYAAAVLTDASVVSGSTNLSREQWAAAFENIIGPPRGVALDAVLTGELAKKIVTGERDLEDAEGKDAFIGKAPKGKMVGSYSDSSDKHFFVSDLDELYDQCGADPNGKILIVTQRHAYSSQETSQAVSLDLMRLLPAENYPSRSDEVEYIVFVDYGYRKDGYYPSGNLWERGTDALQEYAEVKVLRASDGKQLYMSQRIYGDPSPDSIMVSKNYSSTSYDMPAWASGGAPDMGEKIYSAVSWALERVS